MPQCGTTTPFGRPVEPEVYATYAGLSPETLTLVLFDSPEYCDSAAAGTTSLPVPSGSGQRDERTADG